MLLRQVQARPLQGHHLRALRRRGDAAEGAPRAHGSHRPRRSGLAHLVLQGRAEPDRLPARHRAARAREGALLRRLDRHPGRPREAAGRPRRPRGQGRRRERAHLPRPRRGALRPRRPALPPARLLRRRQGAQLRRGRRLLGARPLELGRGVRRCRRSRRSGGSAAGSSSSSPRRSRTRIRAGFASSFARRRPATTAGSRRARSSPSPRRRCRSRPRSRRCAPTSRRPRARRRARSRST